MTRDSGVDERPTTRIKGQGSMGSANGRLRSGSRGSQRTADRLHRGEE